MPFLGFRLIRKWLIDRIMKEGKIGDLLVIQSKFTTGFKTDEQLGVARVSIRDKGLYIM